MEALCRVQASFFYRKKNAKCQLIKSKLQKHFNRRSNQKNKRTISKSGNRFKRK